VQRLCYAGNVVFANPLSHLDRRVPLKAGAELFGAAGLEADAEVIALMLEVLKAAGIAEPILVLGHMGIYQGIVADLDLEPATAAELFSAVQRKAETDIARLLEGRPEGDVLVRLPALMGERDVLEEARKVLIGCGDRVLHAVDHLAALADRVADLAPAIGLRFDLAELVGYGYHNGPVFSAYHSDLGRALARGGRYDDIGAAFGRARPATGFDVILNELLLPVGNDTAVWIPWSEMAGEDASRRQGCHEAVRQLRSSGEVVVAALGADDVPPSRCDRVLNFNDGAWVVSPADA
jgi:ATP phosphoribosyltransferase regulatory subunit